MEVERMESGVQLKLGGTLSGEEKVFYFSFSEFHQLANYFYKLLVGDPYAEWEILNELAGKAMKTILYVDLEDFIQWYFYASNYSEMCQTIGEGVEKENIMTVQKILDNVDYIPVDLILNQESIRKEDIVEAENEIFAPATKYNLQFKPRQEEK